MRHFFSTAMRTGHWVTLFLAGLLALWCVAAQAQTPVGAVAAPPASLVIQAEPEPQTGTLSLHNRKIVTFRTDFLGHAPADRAELARLALAAALEKGGAGRVRQTEVNGIVRLDVDGQAVFFVLAADMGGPRPASMLNAFAQDVAQRLQTAVDEHREMTDPRSLLRGAGVSLAATLAAYLLVRLLLVLRRKLLDRAQAALQQRRPDGLLGRLVADYMEHARSATRTVLTALTWLLVLVTVEFWATFVLHQFAYTRPWGERATAWLLAVLGQFASAIAGAVPGLLIAALIFVLARMAARAASAFLQRVELGELNVAWLDTDTAAPTRRLASVGIWLFALAMAYPYLPGAHSEAFKGVSVLAGLMLSLGASSVVGQALSGLSLMYSRSLRVGEYIKVGETEGTVVALGLFTTKIHTGMGEEVSVPNTVVFSQPIRNFSRLVQDGQFVMHTAVTIGYATPWRQVHAMLLEAARRTKGVATEPPPHVVQTALSDFYVEYRLCAQSNNHAPRRRAEAMSQLHANVQDVFNEHGVQIMSPHYIADPEQPQVVPPGPWSSQSAGPPPSPV